MWFISHEHIKAKHTEPAFPITFEDNITRTVKNTVADPLSLLKIRFRIQIQFLEYNYLIYEEYTWGR